MFQLSVFFSPIINIHLTGLDNCNKFCVDYLQIHPSHLLCDDSLRVTEESSQKDTASSALSFFFVFFKLSSKKTAAHVTQAAADTLSKNIICVRLLHEGKLERMKSYS